MMTVGLELLAISSVLLGLYIFKFCKNASRSMSWLKGLFLMASHLTYRTRAIISRGLYFFYPIFTLSAAYIADNL